MKPLKLTIQAFGPYLQKTVIDFEKLYKNGLFLISGPTGCGKTTILDAMSFALYGAASGEVRNVRDMRSAQAPDELETFVSYEMKLGEDLYKFERSIRVKIVKKRSGEIEKTTVNDENCYHFKDGEWKLICEGSSVNAKAVELLGFSHEQFSQVVVLPQGEFRKLLIEKSSEKETILEQLFGTQKWVAFTNNLARKAKDLRVELAKCSEKTKTLVESTGCENFESVEKLFTETETALEAAEKEYKVLNEDFSKKDTILKSAESAEKKFSELDETKNKLKELNLKKVYVEEQRKKLTLSDKAKSFTPYLDAFKEAKLNLETAKKNLLASTVALGKANSAETESQKLEEEAKGIAPRLEELSKKSTKLNMILDSQNALAENETSIENITKNYEAANHKSTKAVEDLKNLTDKVKTLRDGLAELSEKYLSNLPDLIKEQSNLEVAEKNFSDLAKLETALSQAQKILLDERAQYKIVAQNYNNEKKHLDSMTESFDCDSAYKLSQNLKDGCACPVCGATSHPAPAKPTSGAPSADELDTQKKLVDTLDKKLKDTRANGIKARSDYDNLKLQYDTLKAECEKGGLTFEKLQEKKQSVDKAVNLGKRAAEKQKDGQTKLKTLEDELSKETLAGEALEKEKNKLAQDLAAAKAKAEELKKNVPEEYKDSDAVREKILDCKNEYDSLSKKSEEAAAAVSKAKSDLAAATERMKAVRENLAAAQKAKVKAKEDFDLKFAEFFADVPKELVCDSEKIESLVISDDDSIRDDIKDFDNAFLISSQREKALIEELKTKTRPQTENLRRERDEAFANLQTILERKTTLTNNKESILNVKTALEKTAKREEELSKDYALYARIFDLANGKNPQKTPIHQFILGIMLQDIVTSANIHLSKLSRSRYTLVRSSETSRGGGSKGLELSVDDAWSGGERSVNTLSGGEMFLASLSLAFGLSDVVQSYSGGIRLDSLFIDEGFGSLDSETLEISMNALESLRSSGRLIGIISHVSDLSLRIHDKITVSRNKDGSATAKVEAEC